MTIMFCPNLCVFTCTAPASRSKKLARWLVYIVFDIMFVKNAFPTARMDSGEKVEDDELLMTKELLHRSRVLRAVVKPVNKRIEIIEQRIVPAGTSREDERSRHVQVMRFLDAVMLQNLEGLVLKNVHSTCMPGTRDGSWVKLKPDYIDEMGKVCDFSF